MSRVAGTFSQTAALHAFLLLPLPPPHLPQALPQNRQEGGRSLTAVTTVKAHARGLSVTAPLPAVIADTHSGTFRRKT